MIDRLWVSIVYSVHHKIFVPLSPSGLILTAFVAGVAASIQSGAANPAANVR